jgi:glycosyltransferase involved in cell wall biosynthesis
LKAMKILICSTSNALGGLERRIEDETRLLVAMGHEVVVATHHFEGIEGWKKLIKSAGGRHMVWAPYKFVERQHFAAPFRWLALTRMSLLMREKFDFAHLTLPYNFIGMSMAYLLNRANIPFVVAMHCRCGTRGLPEHGRRIVAEAMQSMVGGYAVSQPANDRFMQLYAGLLPSSVRMVTINNGINTQRFKPDATARARIRNTLGLSDAQFIVMFCGRIQAMKRPLFALSVFASLHGKYPNARLLVVGSGPAAAEMAAEVTKLGLQRSVLAVGHVSDTASYYAASDCYLSTSLNEEGFSLSTAEAMACGLPAVLPNDDVYQSVYGASRVVQLCDPTSQAGWSDALLTVAKKSADDKAKMDGDARTFVQENLTSVIMNKNLTSFYEDIFVTLKLKK